MITVRELEFGYPGNHPVFKSLDLDLKVGDIHGIVGLNGSGKTTLLNLIFGLLTPDGGSIGCNDFNFTRKNMAYLPAENYFYSNITAREYLALFKNPDFNTGLWNKLFGLPLDQIIDDYSSGMKKKLALMGVIKMDKKMMILDEPFNNLDIETNRVLRGVLLKLRDAGKTIIVTSHIIETLTDLCDAIHFLDDGKIRLSSRKSEFGRFRQELYESIEKKTSGVIHEIFGHE